MLGVPLPDATPWDVIAMVGDRGHAVFRHLEHLAAQGEVIFQDDTSVRILSRVKEHQGCEARAEVLGLSRSPERTGMSTTALVVQGGEQIICV
jgi:transposase